MSDEFDQIVHANKQKYLPPAGAIVFHCGAIVLSCLVAGFAYFQLVDVPPELTDADAEYFRITMGSMLAATLMLIGFAGYLIRFLWRWKRMERETSAALVAAGLRQIKRSKK